MSDIQLATTFGGDIECKEESGQLIVRGWASVPVVDRSNEYIDARVINLDEYQANPVFLWCHDRKSMPIGRAIADRQPYTSDAYGLKCTFFHNPDYDFAVKVYNAYKGGYMRGYSIGFKTDGTTFMTQDELMRLGLNPRMQVFKHTGAKLFEISAVPIPDNQSALTVGVVKELMEAMPDQIRLKVLEMVPAKHTFSVVFPTVGKQSESNSIDNPVQTHIEVAKMADAVSSAEVKNETQTAEVPVVEKQAEIVTDTKEMAAVADDGKHGSKAFRHVVENCVKACQEGADMVSKSDHPKAADTLGKLTKKILKGCHGVATKGCSMWDNDDEKSFGELAEKVKGMIGDDADDTEEGDDAGADDSQTDPNKPDATKSIEYVTVDVMDSILDSMEVMVDDLKSVHVKLAEFEAVNAGRTKEISELREVADTLMTSYAGMVGVKID